MLFYSAWPLGYHNVEAERKAVALAEAGFDVLYVAGIGTRNPRLSRLAKVADRLGRRLLPSSPRSAPPSSRVDGLRTAGLLVIPPRQWSVLRRLNRAWVGRQLRAAVGDWERAVAWVRWPTPELVDLLERRRPAAVVYESVDAYHLLPEWTPSWLAVHERAERALVAIADVVAVSGEVLAGRYRAWGADVRVIPHGVDLFERKPPRPDRAVPVLGFVGTLDFRLDVALLRGIARARPHWRVRLVGPVQWGFRRASVADLPNVTIEPPVAHADLGRLLGQLDVVVTPYVREHSGPVLTPVKALEALSAGRPLVSRPLPSLLPYADVVAFADTADEFVEEVERALAGDDEAAVARRRTVAEANDWGTRLAQVVALVDEVAGGRLGPPGPSGR
ncbi:MAG: glycosyltransferase [Acidimicrobiales bacterium]